MTATERAEIVKRLALESGFEAAGIAPAGPIAPGGSYLNNWLARGWAGEMDYLARWRDLKADPCKLLEGARSILVVAHQYKQPEHTRCEDGRMARSDSVPQSGAEAGRGEPAGLRPVRPETARGSQTVPSWARVAQYAWGDDYHKVIRRKLHHLIDEFRRVLDEQFEARACVDTAPLLEREVAALAGIGWIGKNALVLHPGLGSFFFLGEVIMTLDLAPGEPVADHCGSCTRCIEACPTGALVAPHEMDARRCISYLTIEHRSEIAEKLRRPMGEWIYGCDICQDVCPFNRKAPDTREPAYQRQDAPPASDPIEVLAWTEEEYRARLKGSAMKRASLEMLKRNARIVLENRTASS